MSSAREALQPAYLVYGEDRARVQSWMRRLSARLAEEGGFPPERFSADDSGAHEVVEACQAMSLVGMRGVIVEYPDRWRKADAAVLAEYLGAPNGGTCLLLVGDKAPARELVDAVAAVGSVEVAGPDLSGSRGAQRRQRLEWLSEQARGEASRLGADLPPSVASYLVARVAEERAGAVATSVEVRTEVNKLVAYAGGEPIDKDAVRQVTPAHPEARAYELVDAITEGDAERAFGLLQDMATGSPQPVPVIQSALTRHFRALAEAQAIGPRPSPEEVSQRTGMTGFPARKVAEQASSLPPGAGAAALIRAASAELDFRASSLRQLGRSPDDGVRFVLELVTRDLIGICASGH